jgi:Ner family transcriptional regulator
MATTGWHRADIIAALHKRNTSLAKLSRIHRLARTTLSAALHVARKPSNTIIAKVIGVTLHELWPDWYDARGTRIAGSDPVKHRGAASSQKRTASCSKKPTRLTVINGGRG